jgi:hypothetical protein
VKLTILCLAKIESAPFRVEHSASRNQLSAGVRENPESRFDLAARLLNRRLTDKNFVELTSADDNEQTLGGQFAMTMQTAEPRKMTQPSKPVLIFALAHRYGVSLFQSQMSSIEMVVADIF